MRGLGLFFARALTPREKLIKVRFQLRIGDEKVVYDPELIFRDAEIVCHKSQELHELQALLKLQFMAEGRFIDVKIVAASAFFKVIPKTFYVFLRSSAVGSKVVQDLLHQPILIQKHSHDCLKGKLALLFILFLRILSLGWIRGNVGVTEVNLVVVFLQQNFEESESRYAL